MGVIKLRRRPQKYRSDDPRPLTGRPKGASDGPDGFAAMGEHLGHLAAILGRVDCRLLESLSQLFCQGGNAPLLCLGVLWAQLHHPRPQVHLAPDQIEPLLKDLVWAGWLAPLVGILEGGSRGRTIAGWSFEGEDEKIAGVRNTLMT